MSRPVENYTELWTNIQAAARDRDAEGLLRELAAYFKADAAREDHPLVKSILEGCADGCRHLAMDYYVSFK